MLNDTTKPGEVLHKGGLDLLTLLHRRDVELHAHLTLWCSDDDQQRCEHFDHGSITRPSCEFREDQRKTPPRPLLLWRGSRPLH
jgi:hypothetical protein